MLFKYKTATDSDDEAVVGHNRKRRRTDLTLTLTLTLPLNLTLTLTLTVPPKDLPRKMWQQGRLRRLQISAELMSRPCRGKRSRRNFQGTLTPNPDPNRNPNPNANTPSGAEQFSPGTSSASLVGFLSLP